MASGLRANCGVLEHLLPFLLHRSGALARAHHVKASCSPRLLADRMALWLLMRLHLVWSLASVLRSNGAGVMR